MAGKDVTDLPIEMRPGTEITDIAVVLTDMPSPLTGVAQDADQHPAARTAVAVFPVDQKFWIIGSRRFAAVFTGADGRFTISNLPPGDYCAIALASGVPAFDTPAWLSATARIATRVTLREGETATLTLAVR
jgi:hypothetical protein